MGAWDRRILAVGVIVAVAVMIAVAVGQGVGVEVKGGEMVLSVAGTVPVGVLLCVGIAVASATDGVAML